MKKQNGITLIALVITIIVLLILAGVSISSILGDDGLIAKARLAAEKTKQAQLDEHKQLENIDMEMNGGKIKYEVEQKGAYAIIKLYLHVNGSNTYGDYAIEKLYGTSEEEKIEMILAASAFHANKGCWSEPAFESIDELVTYWATNYDMYADCTTLDEIIATGDCENLVDWMISYYYIDPEVLDNEHFDGDKSFTLKSGEAVLVENGSTYMPYVEIPVTASGTYDFELIAGSGTSIKTSVKVNVEGNETVFIVEDGVILGLNEDLLMEYDDGSSWGCYMKSIFKIINIPEEINGQTITEIGEYAFAWLNESKKVILPKTVTTIADNAFHRSDGIEEIDIPGVTYIGQRAFSCCELLEKINNTDNVKTIGSEAFWGCNSLKEINFSGNITSIEQYAFHQCNALTNVKLPVNGNITIEKWAFADCPSLKNINIPNGTTVISERLFLRCTGLEKIVIPDSVTSIEASAFNECTSLKSIIIPSSVSTIASFAFAYCSSLEEVYLSEGVATIENQVFTECTLLTELFIPKSVITMGSSICYKCNADMLFKCEVSGTQSGWNANWNSVTGGLATIEYNATR